MVKCCNPFPPDNRCRHINQIERTPHTQPLTMVVVVEMQSSRAPRRPRPIFNTSRELGVSAWVCGSNLKRLPIVGRPRALVVGPNQRRMTIVRPPARARRRDVTHRWSLYSPTITGQLLFFTTLRRSGKTAETYRWCLKCIFLRTY